MTNFSYIKELASGLRLGRFYYYINSKYMAKSGLKPSADFFTYNHPASDHVSSYIFNLHNN